MRFPIAPLLVSLALGLGVLAPTPGAAQRGRISISSGGARIGGGVARGGVARGGRIRVGSPSAGRQRTGGMALRSRVPAGSRIVNGRSVTGRSVIGPSGRQLDGRFPFGRTPFRGDPFLPPPINGPPFNEVFFTHFPFGLFPFDRFPFGRTPFRGDPFLPPPINGPPFNEIPFANVPFDFFPFGVFSFTTIPIVWGWDVAWPWIWGQEQAYGTDSLALADENPGAAAPRESARDVEARREGAWYAWQVDERARPVEGGTAVPYPSGLYPRQPGEVLAQFVVDATGVPDPATLRILRTSDRALGEAVRAWLPNVRFRPARRDGQWVSQLVEQLFTFRP